MNKEKIYTFNEYVLDYRHEAYVDSAIEGIFFRKINELIDYINDKENK